MRYPSWFDSVCSWVFNYFNVRWACFSFSAFTHCCKESGFFMVFKCREENTAMKECLTAQWGFCFSSTIYTFLLVETTIAVQFHLIMKLLFFCHPIATRTPRSLRSVSRITLKRSWSLRGRGFQQSAGNKNSPPVCNKPDDQQIYFFGCEVGCMRPSSTPWICGNLTGTTKYHLHVSIRNIITISFLPLAFFVINCVITWHCK